MAKISKSGWLAVAATGILLCSAYVVFQQTRRIAELNGELERHRTEIARLRTVARPEPPVPVESSVPPASVADVKHQTQHRTSVGPDVVEALTARIVRLERELNEAKSAAGDLDVKLEAARERESVAAADEKARVTETEGEWKRQLLQAERALAAANAESKGFQQKLPALEAAYAQLRASQSANAEGAARSERMVSDIEEMTHRRDVYLTSLMRRYRDVALRLRSASGVSNSARGPQSSPLAETQVAQILTTLSQAEEDLRQLDAINAQAQKRLAKK